ncbi:uncharacterized protein LOC123210219 [Mangifera indica]|uniref:uncharacterized protein LOC123210219 n=1 Tax=Mangifera indica TaxID=29780 RepID=UPI001CFA64C9|nr:uncharacterized protein LOC123210219 [Mangifera indica]
MSCLSLFSLQGINILACHSFQSNMSFKIFCFVLCIYFSPFVHSSNNYSTNSLDEYLQDLAFNTLVHHRPYHSGALYNPILPANFSGTRVSIVRLRSRRLWNIGANFSNFHIPSRTITEPHARRLAIVYQDFGNWSSHYYSVPGYSLITPVIGFMVFDAWNIWAKRKLSLNTLGKPIVIRFFNSSLSDQRVSRAKCVAFSPNGTLHISEMSVANVCHSQDPGHFSIVVPLNSKRKHRLWYTWVIGFGGMILIGYVGILLMKVLKTKKIQVMERQADEDLVLGNIWVGSSKMPSATVTRTQPTLEDGGLP